MNPVAALQARLRWRRGPGGNEDGNKEEKEWCKETGTSLLWWASTCNDVAAVKVLLGKGGGDAPPSSSSVGGASLSGPASASVVDDAGARRKNVKSIRKELKRGLRRAWPALTLPAGVTPLHTAMAFASPAVVEVLLDAGAAPTARTGGGTGFDPLHVAAIWGAVENIEAWLRRFPSWDLERRDKLVGSTALLFGAATGAGRSLAVTKTLLEAGARADAVNHTGGNLLAYAASNPDMKPNDFRTLLALPQVRGLVDELLNMPMVPRTCKWKLIFKVSGSRTVARGRAVRRHCLCGGPCALVCEVQSSSEGPTREKRTRKEAEGKNSFQTWALHRGSLFLPVLLRFYYSGRLVHLSSFDLPPLVLLAVAANSSPASYFPLALANIRWLVLRIGGALAIAFLLHWPSGRERLPCAVRRQLASLTAYECW